MQAKKRPPNPQSHPAPNPESNPILDINKKHRAAVYCRVSSARQKAHETIEAQKLTCARLLERHNCVDVLEGAITDDGISGTLLEGRAFNELLAQINGGAISIDYLIVYSLSRIARVDNVSKNPQKLIKSNQDAGYIKGILLAHNIKIIDADGIVDPGQITYDIKTMLANEEFKLIRQRTNAGKKLKLSKGYYAKGGKPPYGYKQAKSGIGFKVIVDEDRKDNLIKIFDWFIHGGYHHAARQATKEGIKSPYGKDAWSAKTVQAIVNNAINYAQGTISGTHDGSPWEIQVEPLITHEQYLQIEAASHKRALRSDREQYLSTAIFKCAICSANVQNTACSTNNAHYLKCSKCKVTLGKSESIAKALWKIAILRLTQVASIDYEQRVRVDYSGDIAAIEAQIKELDSAINELIKMKLTKGFPVENIDQIIVEKAGIKDKLNVDRMRLLKALKDSQAEQEKHTAIQTISNRLISTINLEDKAYSQGLSIERQRQILALVMGGQDRLMVTFEPSAYKTFARLSDRPSFAVTLPAIGGVEAVEVYILPKDSADDTYLISQFELGSVARELIDLLLSLNWFLGAEQK